MFNRTGHKFRLGRLGPFGILTLFTALASALISTIWAVYIESLVHNQAYVGLITAGFAIISLISHIVIIPYLETRSKLSVYFYSLIMFGVIYIIYAFTKNLYLFLIIGGIYTFLWAARSISYGEIVRNQCPLKNIGKAESFIYSLANISYLVGPVLAGFISEKYGLNFVFLLSAFFVLISALGFKLIKLKDVPLPKKVHDNFWENIKSFFSDKKIRRAYLISSGIDFWWGVIYTFVPLFIIEQGGLGVEWAGYFFAAVTVPLIFLEYFFGKIGDKKGFRVLFIAGYSGLALAALLCFFFTNIYAVMALLVLASVPTAMVEPTSEAHFFKFIPKNNEDKYYGIYLSCVPVAGFAARILGAVTLLLLPWNYVFIGFAGVMLIYTFWSIRS